MRAWPELDGEQPPTRTALAAVLARANSQWTVVEQAAGYEAAVVEGRIPTRDRSWHDTFNVLAFVSFPRTKAALHGRCFALQRARAGKSPRSREEDALTLIDETSLLFAGSPAAVAAFERARPGGVTELDRVVRGEGMLAYVLGHALLEHLALGRAPIGAGVLTVTIDGLLDRAAVDRALAERIAAGGFPRPQLSPTLPWPDPTVESWLAAS